MKTRKILAGFLAIALLLTSCGTSTLYKGDGNIIEASDVIENLGNAIVIDARGDKAYYKGHLEGAVNLAPSKLIIDDPVKGMLADKETIEKVLGEHGISEGSTVYVYDDSAGVYSARVWWTMKAYGHVDVKVINGGASALVEAGGKVVSDATVLSPVKYTAKALDQSMIVSFDEVKAASDNPGNTVIVDTRTKAERDEGFIPGSVLYPHSRNLYSNGKFMSPRDIKLFYQDLGAKVDQEIILYCKTSFRAAQTAALLGDAGFTNVKVYDGAWLEWELEMGPSKPAPSQMPVDESDGS